MSGAPPAQIHGHVVAGKGQGAYFCGLEWFCLQIEERFGFRPYAGTLNVKLNSAEERLSWARLRAAPGCEIRPEPGFLPARAYPVRIRHSVAGAIIVPEISGYPEDTLELVAPVRLRDAFALKDGDELLLALSV
jgi:riboflavin kinase, archaea type